MANDLKRVGLKLTAEGAEKYKTQLKECTAATKENYSELKLAQSQYDKNTSSVDKLRDRQKYLASQTDVYKDKIKILNRQLEEMENAEKRDEVAISKKRAEINQAQATLNGYEKSLKDVNGQLNSHSAQLKEWGGKLKDLGGNVSKVGDTLTTHVTAPIVGLGAASVAAWKEVDGAMDIIVQKTGASGDVLEDLENRAKSIAETIPTSFETAATAIGECSTRFGVTGDDLENLSTKFVKFADLNKEDVSSAIDETQKALSAFGLDADDAEGFLDVLNRTGQNTGVSMSTLRSGLVQNGAAFQEMGLSIEQSTVFMGQLEKSGANSETVMNGLRKALKNATKEGKPMNQALAELQDTILNGTGSVDGLTASYDMFGKSGDQIYAAVKNGTIDFTQLASTADILKDSVNSVGDTYEETKDPVDQLQVSMNLLKDAGSDLIEVAAPLIAQAMEGLRDIIVDLKEKWDNLSPETQLAIEKALLIAAAVGPLLSIGGRLISGIGSIISLIGTLVPAIATIGAPLLIVIGIVAAAVAVGVLLYKNWDTIKAKAAEVAQGIAGKWNELTSSTVDAWNDIKDQTSQAWNSVKDHVTNGIAAARDNATSIANTIQSNVSGAWDTIKQKTSEKFSSIKDTIFNKIDAARQLVATAIDKIKGLFNFDLSFPNIKLPHFQWHWEDIGGLLSLPHFDGIDWYAKAYDKAARFVRPTVLATAGGFKGFGDRNGAEFVTGESHLRDAIREETGAALRSISGGFGDFVVSITINASEGQDVNELSDIVIDKIETIYERERKAWA